MLESLAKPLESLRVRLQAAVRSVTERASELGVLLVDYSKPRSAHAINTNYNPWVSLMVIYWVDYTNHRHASATLGLFDSIPIFLLGSSYFCLLSLWDLVLIPNWFFTLSLRIPSFNSITCSCKWYPFYTFAWVWLIPSMSRYPMSISSSSSIVSRFKKYRCLSYVASSPVLVGISIRPSGAIPLISLCLLIKSYLWEVLKNIKLISHWDILIQLLVFLLSPSSLLWADPSKPLIILFLLFPWCWFWNLHGAFPKWMTIFMVASTSKWDLFII